MMHGIKYHLVLSETEVNDTLQCHEIWKIFADLKNIKCFIPEFI